MPWIDGAYYPFGSGEEMSEGEYQRAYGVVDGDDPILRSSALDAPEGRWQVAGGAQLHIAKMTDDHLKNAIAACKRFGNGRHRKCRELRRELRERGVQT